MKKTILTFACIFAASMPLTVSAEPDIKELVRKGVGIIEGATQSTPGLLDRPIKDDGKLRVQTEIDGLGIKVKTCTADANGNVILTFTLENITNRDANISGLSPAEFHVFDDEGNEYIGRGSSNSPIKLARNNEAFTSDFYRFNLPSGIMTKFRMKIIDVDSYASILKLVTFKLSGSNGWHGEINFRNVPITREGD